MSEIDTLKIDDVSYSIKDATAREAIAVLNAWKNTLFNSIYPVGSVYVTFSSTFDPNSAFSGTWERCAQGRTLVGVDASNPLFDTANKLYGSPNAIVPEHTHSVDSNTVVSTSSNGAHTHTWSIKCWCSIRLPIFLRCMSLHYSIKLWIPYFVYTISKHLIY